MMNTAAGGNAEALGPGVRLAHDTYVIHHLLGTGGSGLTYRAQQLRGVDQVVVIKEFFPPDSRRKNRKVSPPLTISAAEWQTLKTAFLRTGGLISGVKHRCIPAVYTGFEENNTAYLVQEWVPGQTLAEKFHHQRRPFTVDEVQGYLQILAEALDQLHRGGVLHMDVKPDNIMITPGQDLVLIDYSAARPIAHRAASGAGPLHGTLGFAAPEVLDPAKGPIGPASDVYSLAATGVYLLTGRTPQPGRVPEHLADPLLTTVLAAALKDRPAERIPTMAAFRARLLGQPVPVDEEEILPTELIRPMSAVPRPSPPIPPPAGLSDSYSPVTGWSSLTPSAAPPADDPPAAAPPPPAPSPSLRWPLIALTAGGVLVLLILFVSQSGLWGRSAPASPPIVGNDPTPTLVSQPTGSQTSPTLVAIQIPSTTTAAATPAATDPTAAATLSLLPVTATARPVPPTNIPPPAPPTIAPTATARVAPLPTITLPVVMVLPTATLPPILDDQELRLIRPLFDPQPNDVTALPPPWQDRSSATNCKEYGIHYVPSGSGGYWLYGDFYRFWECNMGSEEYYFDGLALELAKKISQPGEHLLGAPLSQVINYASFMQAIHQDDLYMDLSAYLTHAGLQHDWEPTRAGVQFFNNGVIVCSEVLPKYPRPGAQGDCDLLNAGTLFTRSLPPTECPGGCWQGPPESFDIQFNKPLGIRIGADSQAVYYERLALKPRPDGTPTIAPLGRWLRDLILKPLHPP